MGKRTYSSVKTKGHNLLKKHKWLINKEKFKFIRNQKKDIKNTTKYFSFSHFYKLYWQSFLNYSI